MYVLDEFPDFLLGHEMTLLYANKDVAQKGKLSFEVSRNTPGA